MLDRLDELGQVKHMSVTRVPIDKGGIQFTAMKHADKRREVQNGRLDHHARCSTNSSTSTSAITPSPRSSAALPDATAITLTWRLFGSMGLARYEDKPVLDTFTRAAPDIMYWPWRASMFKTLFAMTAPIASSAFTAPAQPVKDSARSGPLVRRRRPRAGGA